MKRTQEFDGKDIESAVKNACTELSLSKSQLKYDVISTGATGIFGIVGRKNAKIRVKLPEADPDANERAMNDEDYEGIMSIVDEAFGQESDADTDGQSGEEDAEPAKKKALEKGREQKASAGKPESDKPSPAKKESVKEKSDIEKKEPEAEKEPESKSPQQKEKSEKTDEAPVEKISPEKPEPAVEKQAEPAKKEQAEEVSSEDGLEPDDEPLQEAREVVEVSPELAELAEQAVKRMVDLITEDAAVTSEIEGDKLTLRVDGGNAGILIGRKGQTLEAMQFLADKIVNRKSEARVRVKVDIEGYMETRKANLRQLAFKMAEKAKKTGRPATINQMSGQDRRIIHLTLKDDSKVRTQSKGDGYYRRLVILPKKKGSLNSKKRYRK